MAWHVMACHGLLWVLRLVMALSCLVCVMACHGSSGRVTAWLLMGAHGLACHGQGLSWLVVAIVSVMAFQDLSSSVSFWKIGADGP